MGEALEPSLSGQDQECLCPAPRGRICLHRVWQGGLWKLFKSNADVWSPTQGCLPSSKAFLYLASYQHSCISLSLTQPHTQAQQPGDPVRPRYTRIH